MAIVEKMVGESGKQKPTKKLKIVRKFSKNSVRPFDEIEWDIRDAVAGDFKQEGVEAPVCWSDSAVGIVAKLYFATIAGKRENSVKTLIERVVQKIASEGINYGYFEPTDDEYFIFIDELTYILVNQMAAFNTPVWINLGVPGRKQSCSACYLLDVEDTMFGENSITEWWVNEAKIFKTGAGSGVNLSKLRGSMESISIGGIASGPVSFMRPSDSSAGTIKSGSVARRAAKLVCLDIDHPDAIDFIESKVREDKRMRILAENGVNMDPSTPVGENEIAECTTFQNANISVRLSDEFMQCAEDDADWFFRERTTGNLIGEGIPAKDLLRKIAEAAWSCADPGVMFDTTINEYHTTPSLGKIETSNPCCEVHQNNNTSCNLASINLVKFLKINESAKNHFCIDDFNHVVDIMITAMDITCSFSELPTSELEENTRNLRQLGLGYANLGAALMIHGVPYDSDGGREWTEAVTSLMTSRAYRRSAELSDSLGAFNGCAENSEAMDRVLQRHMNRCWALDGTSKKVRAARKNWDDVVSSDGFRNSQVTVIAPTGTISFMMDCDTTGAEPAYAEETFKKLAAGGQMVQTLKCVETAEKNFHKDSDINIFQTASINHRLKLPAISADGHLKMVAAIQPHISGAISKTCNVPNDYTVDDMYHLYLEAWKMGIKCLSVYRDGSKATQILSTKENTNGRRSDRGSDSSRSSGSNLPSSSHLEEEAFKELESRTGHTPRRKMPEERTSLTHTFSIGDYKGYITAGMYDDGTLGEIFLSGIGKDGSTLKGILEGWAIAISMGLQYGVPLKKFADKFSYMRFEPEGLTSNPEIRVAHSILDYVMRWLVSKFGNDEDHFEYGINSPSIKKLRENDYSSQEQAGNGHVVVSDGGKICAECGTTMNRTGTCYTCPSCGANTGCM